VSRISHINQLPVHDLQDGASPFLVRDIAHTNNYDFTQKHRHSYFEIIFFEKGGGVQLIDFSEVEVCDHSCYIIHPNQIHLLNRDPGSFGRLIQFRSVSVTSAQLFTMLRARIWNGMGGTIFQKDEALFSRFTQLLDLFENQGDGPNENERNQHLLQVLLFDLLGVTDQTVSAKHVDSDFNTFLKLVDTHFKEENSVKFYLNELNISDKKLSALTKQHFGFSSLQVIHHRMILEIKRLLLFGESSHKEVAYSLGFDSPSSFSAFVKNKTSQTPSELQAALEKIHQ
jgi:AraC family transcriptional activator of pobA